ncbi:MAG: thioesterase domain-containing protein [Ginsengibacter sp.]
MTLIAEKLITHKKKVLSPLVPIQTKGSKNPLFLVHDGYGQILTYLNLSHRLDPDRPVYGLKDQGLEMQITSADRFKIMASHYVEAIESMKIEAPYHIAGLCLGGVIALEMAQQFKKKGKQVGILAFFGTGFKSNYLLEGEACRFPSKYKKLINYFYRLTLPEKISFFLKNILNVVRKITANKSTIPTLKINEIYAANLRALQDYKPNIYQGKIITFWATKDQRFSPFEQSCWSKIATEGVINYDFPRHHITHVINGPYCTNVVEILRSSLDQIETSKELLQNGERQINKKVKASGLFSMSSLIGIRPQGTKLPIFLIHGADITFPGEIHYGYDLARFLQNSQPVYGLQAKGLDGKTKPHKRIEDMAFAYIKEIQIIQPKGPYLLGGLDFGGLVALEMAQQLKTLGQKISLVVLFDSFKDVGFFQTIFKATNKSPSDKYTKIQKRIDHYLNLFFKYPMGNGRTSFYIRQTLLRAQKNYLPKPYEGNVTIFYSKDKPIDTFQNLPINKLITGQIQSHNVISEEDSRDKNEYLKRLTEILNSYLSNEFFN